MTDTDYGSQRLRLKALSERYNNATVIPEANSMGGPNIEELQAMGVNVIQAFNTTNATKAEAVHALELAFEQQTIGILDDPVQTAELLAYQGEKLPSGLMRYGAPEGMHDDTVMAMAIAWQGLGMGFQLLPDPFDI
jgi:hypothetical protein